MFNENTVSIQVRKNGITNDNLYNVMVEMNGIKICHSSFNNKEDAQQMKDKLIVGGKDGGTNY
jgi:hypothetical protein